MEILAQQQYQINKHKPDSQTESDLKPHIQINLEFVSTMNTVRQQNRLFYQSIHKIVEVPFKELFVKYIKENSESDHVSWGAFIALKPFYVRHTSSKDMEMCCCKLHLHARWSISALLDC